jgi:aubergine-like protein
MKQFAQFHTKLHPELVEFSGRELTQEQMIFGDGKTCVNDSKNVDWTNPMKTNYMYANVDLKRWVIITPRRATADTTKFLQLLSEVANGMKYNMGNPKMIEISDDRVATYANELAKVIPMDPKLVMVILPNNAADRYAAIKKITCVNNAIPTQVIVQKTMMPKKGNIGAVKSVATKVLIQMNCKLGGAAWMIKMPLSGCMIAGFDVNHDSANKSKSYGAFVAALDIKQKPKFFSSVSIHQNNAECSNNIAIHMRKGKKIQKSFLIKFN